jgi:hypothetical protein
VKHPTNGAAIHFSDGGLEIAGGTVVTNGLITSGINEGDLTISGGTVNVVANSISFRRSGGERHNHHRYVDNRR